MPLRPAPSASVGLPPRRSARRIKARARLAFVLRLCLALALVLVQDAAITHVIGHTAEASASRNGPATGFEPDEGARHLAYCIDCLSFSSLDLPLAGGAPHPAKNSASLAAAAFRSAELPAREGLPPRCRAPPACAVRA